ncbi:FAD dependent oxidoreductase [Rubrobacter xylanophilus DSM 9941]|uniref:FAD dependent oxidoreductase n=1 Tax=Rubrobacter xylanophilus (strain DSM 9941 / JCM 11954 / NBRC 16129 / PRD-1) TaxID=266117 RepID=Q1AWW1_RUBXD|nr:FAD-dependent oxidoreductase [Rubrobacter xylanophilus]ABG04117.1 FAD dependent oxidoreductase [Rubrobacter xylanophilus DSM 9941]
MTPDCAIVGAGVSGLLAARGLAEAGLEVLVLEAAPEPGGRLATRRLDGAILDTGAQFFTVRSERFAGIVRGWLESGVAAEWSRGWADASGRYEPDGHPRYRAAGGMARLAAHLARGLPVRCGCGVLSAAPREGGWELRLAGGGVLRARSLLLTPPAPEARRIPEPGSLPEGAERELAGIAYDPCLALLVLLDDGPPVVPEPGGMQVRSEAVDWISDNRRKGISPRHALTVHASPRFSRENYAAPEGEAAGTLLRAAGEALGTDLRPRLRAHRLKRWPHSWVARGHPGPALLARRDPPLLFCGDAFRGARIEGAALSGLGAAEEILRLLSRDTRGLGVK